MWLISPAWYRSCSIMTAIIQRVSFISSLLVRRGRESSSSSRGVTCSRRRGVLPPVPQAARRVVPGQRGVSERVVVVHVLAGGDVGGEEADRAGAAGGLPEPVLGGDGAKVAHQRMLALIDGHIP